MDSNESFVQEGSNKSMRKTVFYPGEVGHNIVRILRILKEFPNDSRSLLDEVRVLPG